MNRTKISPLCLIALLLWAAGCGNKTTDDGFNRTAMLSNLGNEVIIPAHQDFAAAASTLNQAVLAFTGNPEVSTLQTLASAYEDAYLAFMQVEAYSLEPSTDLRTALNSFPPDTAQIKSNAISSPGTYNLNTAANAKAKGFPALDYLLYNEVYAVNIIHAFSTDPHAANRSAYLVAIAAEIKAKADAANQGWNNYLVEFTAANGTDIGGSTSILVNDLAFTCERGRRERVGNALGYIGLINSGTKDPGLVEAGYSDLSKELLIKNIQALKKLYTGGTGQGFDDYLEHLGAEIDGQPTAAIINTQFDLVLQKAEAIPVAFDVAVNSNNDQMESLFLELKKLTVLLKVDLSSQLGVSINYSDNDGD